MKKLIFCILMLVTLNAQSQKNFVIEHCVDKMTGKEYYISTEKFFHLSKEKTKGYSFYPVFKKSSGNLTSASIICKSVNIGGCNEKDELIFLFEDDSRITLTSWNKFNCDGNSYFDFTKSEADAFSTKKLVAVRFVNGRTHESLTCNTSKEQSDYLIRAFTKQEIVEVNCSN